MTATTKQRTYITALLCERDTSGTGYENWTPDWDQSTPAMASAVISVLTALPRRKPTDREVIPAPEPGMYHGHEAGTVYRVYYGQQAERNLVKQLTDDGYVYRGSAAKWAGMIGPRMTQDEARELGRTTGRCCVCDRTLTDPESVDAGIGPICAVRV